MIYLSLLMNYLINPCLWNVINFEMLLTNQEVYGEVSSCDKVNLPNAVNSILERD